jgi:hypothetical protein
MCKGWSTARSSWDWKVNLSKYENSSGYPQHFKETIDAENAVEFEKRFQAAIRQYESENSYIVAGEVTFWKNFGNYQSRNRLTNSILTHLSNLQNWKRFVTFLEETLLNPTVDNFNTFRQTCDQKNGFATPITFLAFKDPDAYPMVDKRIAYWWAENRKYYGYSSHPRFDQRNDGWIQCVSKKSLKENWAAYLHWQEFCAGYSRRLSERCGSKWRARDVEMAIWQAQKKHIVLETLT